MFGKSGLTAEERREIQFMLGSYLQNILELRLRFKGKAKTAATRLRLMRLESKLAECQEALDLEDKKTVERVLAQIDWLHGRMIEDLYK